MVQPHGGMVPPSQDDGAPSIGASLLALLPVAGSMLSGSATKVGEKLLEKGVPAFVAYPLNCNVGRGAEEPARWALAIHSNIPAGAYIVEQSGVVLVRPATIGLDSCADEIDLPLLLAPGVVTRLVAEASEPGGSGRPSKVTAALTIQRLDADAPFVLSFDLIDVSNA